MKRGFTLIELLIVIAIIAILALIAIPNFLEAQVRAKVSRARGDMRTVAIAIEAYFVDWNAYPPNDGEYNTPSINITTPIAYLTSKTLIDPFAEQLKDAFYGDAAKWYTYGVIYQWDGTSAFPVPPPPIELVDHAMFNPGALEKYGWWRMVSLGPDLTYSDFARFDYPMYGADILYDPTNGTISWGNLLRTQKDSEGVVRK